MKNKVVLGLGSNIDPDENIEKARQLLHQNFHVLSESDYISTKPVGYTQQDDFINGSIYIETDFTQEELVQHLKSMEKILGRRRSEIKFGPRTIDLDLIVFNGRVVDQDFYERDFLKKSVLQLIPDLNY
ncbi:MAG: 2-amino-4-hydroxy-6-hydroxymethyldihydropteridine diphosphokinase [Candidatus Omnitrophica bacterium]|nr:2-amino-4-hydroxy-6-hydroxymethyldihydropteridine diphosphokinase [Candidatus Omnitrophota bacterium]